MAKLVRLWQRPCKRGREFKYVLIWYDEQGKERWQSLGHTDARKAEQQLVQKERELRDIPMSSFHPSDMIAYKEHDDWVNGLSGRVIVPMEISSVSLR